MQIPILIIVLSFVLTGCSGGAVEQRPARIESEPKAQSNSAEPELKCLEEGAIEIQAFLDGVRGELTAKEKDRVESRFSSELMAEQTKGVTDGSDPHTIIATYLFKELMPASEASEVVEETRFQDGEKGLCPTMVFYRNFPESEYTVFITILLERSGIKFVRIDLAG